MVEFRAKIRVLLYAFERIGVCRIVVTAIANYVWSRYSYELELVLRYII